MSDAIDERQSFLNANIRTPEMEMAEQGGSVPAAADLALVAVTLGGVEVAVADLEGAGDGAFGVGAAEVPGAEAELGDGGSVQSGVEHRAMVPHGWRDDTNFPS